MMLAYTYSDGPCRRRADGDPLLGGGEPPPSPTHHNPLTTREASSTDGLCATTR
jgi:hypothetical protein